MLKIILTYQDCFMESSQIWTERTTTIHPIQQEIWLRVCFFLCFERICLNYDTAAVTTFFRGQYRTIYVYTLHKFSTLIFIFLSIVFKNYSRPKSWDFEIWNLDPTNSSNNGFQVCTLAFDHIR